MEETTARSHGEQFGLENCFYEKDVIAIALHANVMLLSVNKSVFAKPTERHKQEKT